MERTEMLLRLGFYSTKAGLLLDDYSYAQRFIKHAETVTQEQYLETVTDINERLIAAGHVKPDEDLFEKELRCGPACMQRE